MKLATTLQLAMALLVLGMAPAAAQSSSAPASDSSASSQESTVPDDLQGMVGDWQLEQEDQSIQSCPLTLSDQQSTGGWAVQFPETCQPGYPSDKIVTWNIDTSDGSVLLSDAAQHVVLHLFEDEDGLFDTADGEGPKFYMLPPEDSEGNGGENDADD